MDLHQAKRTSQEVTETTETTETTESTESTEIGSTQQSDSQLSLKVKLKSISTHTIRRQTQGTVTKLFPSSHQDGRHNQISQYL